MNEMENQRIVEELNRQRLAQNHHHHQHHNRGSGGVGGGGSTGNFNNRHSKDSGVVDIEMLRVMGGDAAGTTGGPHGVHRLSAPECGGGLKKNALSNSLIDLSEGQSVFFWRSFDNNLRQQWLLCNCVLVF